MGRDLKVVSGSWWELVSLVIPPPSTFNLGRLRPPINAEAEDRLGPAALGKRQRPHRCP